MLIIDLDSTLLNVRELFRPIDEALIRRHTKPRVDAVFIELVREGYTQREHMRRLGDPVEVIDAAMQEYKERLRRTRNFLYPGMEDLLTEAEGVMPVVLMTAGDPETQWGKINNLPSPGRFTEIVVVTPGQKGPAVAERTSALGPSWFVDDAAQNHLDVLAHAPWVRRVRMDWHQGSHPDDGRLWTLARSAHELRLALGLT